MGQVKASAKARSAYSHRAEALPQGGPETPRHSRSRCVALPPAPSVALSHPGTSMLFILKIAPQRAANAAFTDEDSKKLCGTVIYTLFILDRFWSNLTQLQWI
jgi:hypothetical protein